MNSDESDFGRDERIRLVIQECIIQRANGRSLTDEAVIESHPDLLPELAEQLAKLQRVEAARRQAKSTEPRPAPRHCPHCSHPIETSLTTDTGDFVCDSCGNGFSLVISPQSVADAEQLQKVGPFELLDQIGFGAFGTVWSAFDSRLDRVVALKLPHRGDLTATESEQFQREARTAAGLKHPRIVSVFEVGRHGTQDFIASELIEGHDLATWLLDHSLTVRDAVELCATVADALHHAHCQGVIHRDLKPSNILIDDDGEPHLTDFGLAKRDAAEVTLTVEGKLLGTPAYMSPEQARGTAHAADARSDIYSLGVILFELLTGQRPFQGNVRILLQQILTEDVPSPRRLNPNVPRDVETICLKCVEKSPDRRYQTASELRDDLQRFLGGQMVRARPIGRLVRAWRWCQRKPVAACLLALIVSLAVIGPAVAIHTSQLAFTRQQAIEREKALRIASDDQLYATRIGLAHQAVSVENNVVFAQQLLKQSVPSSESNPIDRRGFEWFFLDQMCREADSADSFDVGNGVNSMDLSPDGEHLAVGCGEKWRLPANDVAIWNWKTGERLGAIPTRAHNAKWVDDGHLALAGMAGDVVLWTVAEEHPEVHLPLPAARTHEADDPVRTFLVSPDRRVVAIVPSVSHVPIVWNLVTRTTIELAGPVRDVMAMAIHGEVLACAHWDGSISFWSLADGTISRPSIRSSEPFIAVSLAFAPSGNVLAVGGEDGTIQIWNLLSTRDADPVWLEGHTHRVASLAFLDEKQLASGSEDKTLRLWDLSTGQSRVHKGHGGRIQSVVYHRAESRLMSGGADGLVKVWDLDDAAPTNLIRVPKLTYGMRAIDFSPETGDMTVASDGRLKLFDSLGKESDWATGSAQSVSYSPDGVHLAISDVVPGNGDGASGSVALVTQIWDVAERRQVASLPGRFSCFSADGTHLFVIADGLHQWAIDHSGRASYACVVDGFKSFNGGATPVPHRPWVVVGGGSSAGLRVWNYEERRTEFELPIDYSVTGGCLFPHGRQGAVAALDGSIHLWDVEVKRETAVLEGHGGPIWALDISPDGKTLVSGSDDGTVKLWHVKSGSLLLTLNDHHSAVVQVRFSEDGQRLVTGSVDGTIWIRRADRSSDGR